jgi:hypothetical protein
MIDTSIEAGFYTWSTNSLARGVFIDKCSQHYIRTEVAREIVLTTIKATAAYVRENEAEFVERLREASTVKHKQTARLLTRLPMSTQWARLRFACSRLRTGYLKNGRLVKSYTLSQNAP